MRKQPNRSRRRFILGGLGLGGALLVGWGVLPPRQRLHGAHALPTAQGELALNGWIKMGADGKVMVVMHRVEMGQGIHTALQMLVAEELDVPMQMVQAIAAPIDKIYGNIAVLADGLPFHPDDQGSVKKVAHWMTSKLARELGLQITGGSSSVKDAWLPMREAGATARAMLVKAAAQRWQVPEIECQVQDGVVRHGSGRSASYAELAAEAVNSQPGQVRLKSITEFKLIGRAQPRTDLAGKVNGQAQFGIDARPPGLRYAAIKMAPILGAEIEHIDQAGIAAMPGNVKVVDLSAAIGPNKAIAQFVGTAAVAVMADSYWQAKQACDASQVRWKNSPHAQLSSATVMAELQQRLKQESGFAYFQRGDADSRLAQAASTTSNDGSRRVQAEYRAPFLAHATMEPINCTAQFKDGYLTIWVSTQVPSLAVAAASKLSGVAADKITLHVAYLGGGFGRRLEIDMVVQAVALAMQSQGAPVQLIWSRETDTANDMYRPAVLAHFDALLDAQGEVQAYAVKSASGSVTHQVLQRSFGLPGVGPDKTTAEGEFDMPYEFAHQTIRHVIVPTPVPLGFWRSVGHSHHAFFKESFIDELAHAAGKTPLAFRRRWLQAHPRHLAVLEAAVAKAGQVPEGRAHGIALHQSFGSIVCEVAEVSVSASADNKTFQVHRVVCAVDCGIAVNPDIIEQQMTSAIVFGLSAALYGEISFKDGRVEQSNFHDYQVLRMYEAPTVEVVIMPSTEPPEGVGEPGTPPIAPAVANALFQLTGQRLRSLPLKLV